MDYIEGVRTIKQETIEADEDFKEGEELTCEDFEAVYVTDFGEPGPDETDVLTSGKATRAPLTPAERMRAYRKRKRLRLMDQPTTSKAVQRVPLTPAERMRAYRKRKKLLRFMNQPTATKATRAPLTPAERMRAYRKRTKGEEDFEDSEELTCQEFKAVYVMDFGNPRPDSIVVKVEPEDIKIDHPTEFNDIKPEIDSERNSDAEKPKSVSSEGPQTHRCPSASGVDGLEEDEFLQCDACGYACADERTFRIHIQCEHSFERRHECPHCDCVCASGSNLKRHIQAKHTLERPHQCPHCYYACVRPSSLKMHIQSKHTGERPHQCPHCDYACVTKRTLKNHIHARHTIHCFHCDFTCIDKTSIKEHFKESHAL